MKRKLFVMLAALMCQSCICMTACGAEVSAVQAAVNVNGKNVSDEALLSDGNKLIPARGVLSELGFELIYEPSLGQLYVCKNKKLLIMTVGSSQASYKGETTELSAAPVMTNGSVYIPYDVISGVLGYDVNIGSDGSVSVLDPEDEKDKTENTGTIDLDASKVTGEGVSIDGNVVKITKGGDFTVKGSFNGSITVDTNERVKLRLDGVNIKASDGPAIDFKNTDKSFITLEEGSKNILADSENYSDEDAKATLFSNADLEIKGSGSLEITSVYKHGIASDDVLDIENGNVSITAKSDGLHANDGIEIKGGNIVINAGEDGIDCEGYTDIADGVLKITASGEAEPSANNDFGMHMNGNAGMKPWGGQPQEELQQGEFPQGEPPQREFQQGELPQGDFPQREFQQSEPLQGMPEGFKMQGTKIPTDEQTESTTDAYPSSKGISSDGYLMIRGGNIEIDSNDTCIKSESFINVSGGSLTLDSSVKKGIKATDDLFVNGGTLTVNAADEGLESKRVMTINGGDIKITSKDDGINAGGGNGGMRGDPSEYGEHHIIVNGGKITIDAGGDGIDSNGNLTFNGGECVIYGPENGGNSAMDANGEINVNGGILLAFGSVGMVETPSENSKQNVINAAFDNVQNGGSEFRLTASDGSVTVSDIPEKTYQSVIYSSPDIKDGESYTISANGVDGGSAKVDGKITSIGENAERGMGFGGMKRGMGHRPVQIN